MRQRFAKMFSMTANAAAPTAPMIRVGRVVVCAPVAANAKRERTHRGQPDTTGTGGRGNQE